MFDGIYMAIMLLDHLDRGANLLGEDINIDTFAKPEGGVGVPEAIG